MTRSLVSQATTTTLSVTKTLTSINAMSKYNEEKELEIEKVAKAMEQERLLRLKEEQKL